MYAAKYGQQASKNHALSWGKKEFPQWRSLLEDAEGWRKKQWQAKQEAIGSELPKVTEFINFAIDQVAQAKLTRTISPFSALSLY
jgi:hypothetical protein